MIASRWTTSVLAAGLLSWPVAAMALQADAPKPAPPAPPVAAPAAPAAAEKPAENPTEQPAQELKIRITAVQGYVQVRLADDKPWAPATVGMDLVIGARLRTGLRSAVQFTIDGNHTVSVDRLGEVGVLDAIRKDGKVKTDVGMRYGRTQYKVDANADEHEARIHAPTATLAVRGSVVELTDDDAFGSYAIVDDSKSASYTLRGSATLSVAKVDLQRGPVVTRTHENKDGAEPPAEVLQRESNLDTGARLGRANEGERDLVTDFQSHTGNDLTSVVRTTDFRLSSNSNGIRGGVTAVFVPGSLVIELNWVGSADLDLIARDGAGGLISTVPDILPGASTALRPGGPRPATAGPDHNGPNGTERIVWNNPPAGNWTSGVKFFSGASPADYTLKVTQFPTQSQSGGRIIFMQTNTLSPGDGDAVGSFPVQVPAR